MKLIVNVFCALLLLASIASCKKCYECSKESTLLVKGEEVPASATEDVCGKKDKKSMEGDGFTCIKTDKK